MMLMNDDNDVMMDCVCWQATGSKDRVRKFMKFYGRKYSYDSLQLSDVTVELSDATVSSLLSTVSSVLSKAQIPLCRLPRDVRDKPVTSPQQDTGKSATSPTSPCLVRARHGKSARGSHFSL